MLIANSGGMLQHSDSKWRVFGSEEAIFISILNRSSTDSSIIWSGSFSNLGYFEHSDTTLFSYRSLTELLPDSLRDFRNIMGIEEFNQNVYFLNDLYLFKYNVKTREIGLAGDVYELIQDESDKITHIRMWQNALYVFLDNGRAVRLTNSGNASIFNPEGDQGFRSITTSIPWMQYLLLADKNRGLLLFDGVSIQEFDNKVNDYIVEHIPQSVAVFEDGKIAVSTDDGGTVVINRRGEFEYLLSAKTGLKENIHNSLYIDHNQDLWIAGNESISKIYTGVPVQHRSGETFGFADALQVTHFDGRF